MWAANIWQPTMTSGTRSTPLYVSVFVNGVQTTNGLEVAAFVDDECRASSTTANQLNNSAYLLRVWGTEEDMGKTITFKAFHNNLVYAFTLTQSFDNETETHTRPIVLNLDAVMGVSLTNPINITANIPAVYDLTSDVTILYDEANRKNESTLESAFTYQWTPAAAIITVNTSNVLTATDVTSPDGITLDLTVKGPNYGSNAGPKMYSFSTSTQVIVTEPVVEVSSITLNPTSITAQIGDNYKTKIDELVTVTVLPNEATNKEWTTAIAASSTATVSTANVITAPGTLTVIISSVSNPAITATLTITVPTPVEFTFPADLTLSKLHATDVAFTWVKGDNFDKDLITITFANSSADAPCATATMSDATGLKWYFTGQYVGDYTYQVSYNGTPMKSDANGTAGMLHIPAEVALNNAGWDWISLYAFQAGQMPYALKPGGATSYLGWLNQDANNKMIEVRSQTALLFNDEYWGFIGDITELSPAGGMYKVKAKYANASDCVLNLGADCVPITSTTVSYNTIQKGYTWISYPLETATTIANTRLGETAQTGDKIIGKTSSAEYDGSQWLPADFVLQPGKGYIYYTESNGGFRPNFNAPAGSGVKRFAPSSALNAQRSTFNAQPTPWKYDASPFADNMPVVAAVEGIEDGERFSIGAFVGDECRGEGRAVDNNLFMINVAGKSGELVHFRVFDKVTEEFFDLDQSLIYTAQHGSLKAPVRLSGIGVVDGISTVQRTEQEEATYTLTGQKVNKNFRGVVVTKGHKQMKR